ncbi:uncharacterized protein LOC131427810 [Malaya genurostris]|uniref:uncharacterized protein LOC131427810 n=1 Tax=Malaya genurostris TaxID=325434 RepID=UPI0026F3DC31|nr:uncharacterized protein LOC131427810 [Malaya genurostris]
MANIKRQFNFQESLNCSQSSGDRKAKVRKTIEVTRSTRYTEIVEGNSARTEQNEVMVGHTQFINTQDTDTQHNNCNTGLALMDGSLNNIQETMDDDRERFILSCRESADSYLKRLDQVEIKLEANAKLVMKCKKFEENMLKENDDIRKGLQELLEMSRKKHTLREETLAMLLDKF